MFDWLFGRSKKPTNVATDGGNVIQVKITGHFKYSCLVECHELKQTFIAICEVKDNVTRPRFKCRCGCWLELFDAPIVSSRTLGERTLTTRKGELTVIVDERTSHRTTLGETMIYRVDD